MDSFITMNEVSQSFNGEDVLTSINLEINEGEIYGLLGPSGSGKTTLVKTIVGTLKPSSGTVYVQDVEMPSLKKLQDIGYMAQADALYSELTAKENLAFFAKLYGIPRHSISNRIDEVLSQVDLLESKNKLADKFSGGMKRRLSLAIALLHKPKILILDEPTVGIDPILRNKVWNHFYEMKQQGISIIITTHVMDEAEKCDQLALLRDGKIMASGSPSKLKKQTNTSSIEQSFLYYGGVQT
ncbi:ATP-binding cassette domain-containing protein [Aquibacillus halophilus]|uniref:ATP-binding cassette domain-containing protein n=1 Tax=Aquibacillus halophilus TaxID=930132 RepID=A0A6A8DDD7_9BACI|nr:ABC transporter ATP-binding protein [Aquibacillus halophilus]MRH43698.1 ATP-binding cassette domain-containing protein [Aquibacillus halophilus]